MDPLTIGALAGVTLGMLKGDTDAKRANRQRQVEAVTAQYSPWTKMQPKPVQEADPFGSMMQGGLTGAMMGGQFKGAGAMAPDAAGGAMAPAQPEQPYGAGKGVFPDARTPQQQSPWLYSPGGR